MLLTISIVALGLICLESVFELVHMVHIRQGIFRAISVGLLVLQYMAAFAYATAILVGLENWPNWYCGLFLLVAALQKLRRAWVLLHNTTIDKSQVLHS